MAGLIFKTLTWLIELVNVLNKFTQHAQLSIEPQAHVHCVDILYVARDDLKLNNLTRSLKLKKDILKNLDPL
ncbi:hypothetical protein DPMN_176694 [Dreissena polymorpha]|uniref:Uncharacterized protein n=1 Tax=Dreissena polymorpha TaxID=45954 RepID=A0A9D4IKV4_DREPO|nr:hypothetical protein DPMN_176694 [Dreissena polymorpha]